MFWWPLHYPLREQRIPLVPNSFYLYLAAATVWCSLIGLFVAFGRSGSSSHYLRSIDTLHLRFARKGLELYTRDRSRDGRSAVLDQRRNHFADAGDAGLLSVVHFSGSPKRIYQGCRNSLETVCRPPGPSAR